MTLPPEAPQSETHSSARKISAVLFDYGMVLSGPPDPLALQEMQTILDTDEQSLQAMYWKYRDAYDRGALSGLAYWETIGRDLGRPVDAAHLEALIEADTALWTQPNHAMIEWAAALQREGFKTGILSNIGDAMEAGIRARFPWMAEFAHHTFSHKLGIAKPDPAIYRHAAEGLGVPVGEILFVDDKEENILAARTAGMNAVRYTSHEAFVQELESLGWRNLLTPEAT